MDLLVLSRYADHNLASAQDASVPPRLEPVAVGSACHYPQVRIGVGPNPEGIAPSTPGLRACELPWEIVQTASQPQRGCDHAFRPRTQPRWGWLVPTQWTQGSSFLATLGFVAESLWDSRKSLPKMWVMTSASQGGRSMVTPTPLELTTRLEFSRLSTDGCG